MEGSRQLSSRALLRVGFVFEASLVGVAVVLARIHTGEWFPFRLEMDLEAVAWTAGATVPLILFAIFFSTDAALRFRPFRRMYRVLGSLMGKALVGLSPLQLAVLALSAGVGEEFLFRGVIQNEWGGIGTASLIFALLHAVTPAYFVFAFAISVYFGWIYIETGHNLLVPILLHSIYDWVAFLALRRRFRREDFDELEAESDADDEDDWNEPSSRDRSSEPHERSPYEP